MVRSKGYQDLEDSHVRPRSPGTAMPPPQEIEMASVSVVPDGKSTFQNFHYRVTYENILSLLLIGLLIYV